MKKKILLFIAIFSVGIIVTYPAFAPSHALDSYCTIYNGYKDTANWFLQNGRVFSALLMYFYNLVKLPVDSMNFVTLFFFNLFLALAITNLFLVFDDRKENKIVQGIILVCTFMLFYGPLVTEILFLNEAMIFALGILLVTLSAYKLYLGGVKNYIISLILMIFGVTCYQGIACYFFVILLLFLMKNRIVSKEELVSLLKKIGIGILIYGISALISFGIVQAVSNIFSDEIPKLGNFNMVNNFVKIFTDLLPSSLFTLFGFINVKYYYLLCILLLVVFVYLFVKNDHKGIRILLFIGLLVALIIVPFAPNLIMSESSNYIAARMTLTLGIIPSVLALYTFFNYDFNIKLKYVIGGIVLIFMMLSVYSIHQNTMISFRRYKEDVKYINSIVERINWYEAENNNKVKTIYYAPDTSVNYYYSFGNANGANIRLLAVDWALDCAFPVYTYEKYEFKKMSDEDYKKYFKGKNYDEFSKEQLVFNGDSLYLLLY